MLRMLIPSARPLITADCFSVFKMFAITQLCVIVPQQVKMSTSIFVPHKQKSAKIGRPKLPDGEAKSETLRIRITPSEYKAIGSASGAQPISEWARTTLLMAARFKRKSI
jgi:hypothetical protein